MPRPKISDIVPRKRKSIRNINRAPNRRVDEEESEYYDDVPRAPTSRRGGVGFFSRYSIWIVAVILLAIIIAIVSLFFSGSKVVVTPKQKDVSLSGQFSAFQEPERDQLPYEIISVESSVEETVSAQGTERVEERASGRIAIFNDFSSEEQRLITNTRFETPDGLIYRIREPVVVPGQRKEGSDTVPGRIEVTVFADEPGERYNVDLVDFTIPGFRGSPQFDGFFARSLTPMAGGFVGDRAKVSEETRALTIDRLEGSIQEKLLAEAHENVPEGFHLFDEALFFEFSSPEIADSGEDQAVVRQKGVAYGVLLSDEEFARHIARETVAGYDGEPVRLSSVENLTLTPSSDTARPWQEDSFSFSLDGTTRVIWVFDEEQLTTDLGGRSREALPTILSGYPSIDKAEIVLRPFWKQTFPDDPNKITVETVLSTE